MANSRIVNGPMQVLPTPGVGDRTLAVGATASSFIVAALNANSTHVYWSLDGCDMRVTIDGGTPTAGAGHIFKDGNSGIWSAAWANAAKVIAVSGSGTITISELNYA
jgi:hypothetical protein